MKRLKQWVLVGVLGLVLLPVATWAGETDVLLNKLVEKHILTSSEAQEIRNEAQKISINGDMRLRHESRERTSGDVSLQRIRFRLGMKAKVSDPLEVYARFATGSQAGGIRVGTSTGISDPVSTNQSLSDTFAKKNFNLDVAYIKYSPETSIGSLAILGGIFDNPFSATSLVWDSDLTFGGTAFQWSQTFGPAQPFVNGGIFPIDSGASGSDNPNLYGAQVGVTLKPIWATGIALFDNVVFKAAVAHYDYANVDGNPFRELNPYVEITSQGFNGVPVAIWADLAENTASSSQAKGSQFGVKIGKATTPWDTKRGWELGYFTQELEANAVFSAFADSDFGGGGTNRKGNVAYLTFATLKNSNATVKYLNADQIIGSASHDKRIQVDWMTKF